MIDEDLMAPVGEFVCDPRLVDFEENLEALIVIAQSAAQPGRTTPHP